MTQLTPVEPRTSTSTSRDVFDATQDSVTAIRPDTAVAPEQDQLTDAQPVSGKPLLREMPLPETSDEEWVIARAQHDPAAFSLLYERYVDKIFRYVYRRVQNRVEAEDLTAQTFQQALAALPTYEWRGVPFGAWLYRIAGNLVSRHRQIKGREVAVDYIDRIVDERTSFEDPLDTMLQESAKEQLLAAMQKLSPDQQRALVLKYSHGLKNHEVGVLMNRTEGGVKQLVHRAMVVLRRELGNQPEKAPLHLVPTPDFTGPPEPTHAA